MAEYTFIFIALSSLQIKYILNIWCSTLNCIVVLQEVYLKSKERSCLFDSCSFGRCFNCSQILGLNIKVKWELFNLLFIS